MHEARCMKCRTQVPIKDPQEVVNARGLKMVQGTCGTCGTKVCRILGKA
jgi:hypothetical protein